jgi:ABC-type amino acid transport substrate-binding protein
MGITEERLRLMDFTDRYYRSLSVFIELPGHNADISPAGMKGKRIGAEFGSLQAKYLNAHYAGGATLVFNEDIANLLGMLNTGELDLVLADGLAAYDYLKSDLGGRLETVGKPVESSQIPGWAHIAVSKRLPGLKHKLNDAIQAIRHSGEYDRINRRYFEFSIY